MNIPENSIGITNPHDVNKKVFKITVEITVLEELEIGDYECQGDEDEDLLKQAKEIVNTELKDYLDNLGYDIKDINIEHI